MVTWINGVPADTTINYITESAINTPFQNNCNIPATNVSDALCYLQNQIGIQNVIPNATGDTIIITDNTGATFPFAISDGAASCPSFKLFAEDSIDSLIICSTCTGVDTTCVTILKKECTTLSAGMADCSDPIVSQQDTGCPFVTIPPTTVINEGDTCEVTTKWFLDGNCDIVADVDRKTIQNIEHIEYSFGNNFFRLDDTTVIDCDTFIVDGIPTIDCDTVFSVKPVEKDECATPMSTGANDADLVRWNDAATILGSGNQHGDNTGVFSVSCDCSTDGYKLTTCGRHWLDNGVGSVIIGANAGMDDTQANTVDIGNSAGQNNQTAEAINIGLNAGQNNNGGAVNIGVSAGQNHTGGAGINIGSSAGLTASGGGQINIGRSAGKSDPSTLSINIGSRTGQNQNSSQPINIGDRAGENNQGDNTILIGQQAGRNNTGGRTLAIGRFAGLDNTGLDAVFYGNNAGDANTGSKPIGIGTSAAQKNTGVELIGIGSSAGRENSATLSLFIGTQAGEISTGGGNNIGIGDFALQMQMQNSFNIGIGSNALSSANGTTNVIAIGRAAGSTNTQSNRVIIGIDELPQFANAAAAAAVLPASGTDGVYLFWDLSDNTIKANP